MAIPMVIPKWSYHVLSHPAGHGARSAEAGQLHLLKGSWSPLLTVEKEETMGSLTTLNMLFFGGNMMVLYFWLVRNIDCLSEIFCSPRETFTNQVGLIWFRRAVDFHVLVGLGRETIRFSQMLADFWPMTDPWCWYIWCAMDPINKNPSHVSIFLPAPAGSVMGDRAPNSWHTAPPGHGRSPLCLAGVFLWSLGIPVLGIPKR